MVVLPVLAIITPRRKKSSPDAAGSNYFPLDDASKTIEFDPAAPGSNYFRFGLG